MFNKKNPQWMGDNVGYNALHAWVRRNKKKPSLCEKCKKVPPKDLANKRGLYVRDLNEWEYLCRKCHMINDGRLEKWLKINVGRKHDDAFKKKVSLFQKGNTWRLGQKASTKTKLKMSITRKGRIVTEETRKKISNTLKNKTK